MFSKNKKSKILSFTFIVMLAILISNAIFWQSFIINEMNERLASNRFKILSAKISGNLFSSIKIRDVKVTHPIYGDLSINKSVINLDFISSLLGRLTFDYISIENLITQSLNSALNETRPIKNYSSPKIPFDIDQFFISGQIPIDLQSDILVLVGEIEGSINNRTDLKIHLSKLSLKNQGENSLEFNMSDFDLVANEHGIIIDQFSGRVGDAPISGVISYINDESKIYGSINIDEFFISEDLFSQTPLKGKFSKISGTVDFESVGGNTRGNLSIANKLGLEMNGDINVIKKDSNILLRSLNLYGEDSG